MLAATYRAGEVAFKDAPLLRRLGWGEEVARVECGVAGDEVELPMVGGSTRLGHDFDTAAAGAAELRAE